MKQLQKGFTLIELMIVVAIIGILAAVAIPAYQDYVVKAKLSKVQSTLDPLKLAMAMYNQENGSFPTAAATTVNSPGGGATANTVWSSLGLTTEPSLPKETLKLVYTSTDGTPANTDITITLDNIKVLTIDGVALKMVPTVSGTAVTWANTCTSGGAGTASTSVDAIAKKYFTC